jgi:beta-glucosidase
VSFTTELTVNETDRSGFAAAIKLAKSSEVVIMVLGEHGFMSGEGRSRTRLNLPGLQQQLLEEVYKVNKNIVLVLMNGRPLALPWAAKNIPAIVEAWHLGTESGNAIAEVLYGAYNPSGKLPMSFPRHEGQVPIYYNQMSTGRPNAKPDVFWSHYSDESNQPLFPFGYGLSYSKFTYSDMQIDSSKPNAISVSAVVKNTGKVAGEEVVQLYIRDRVASISRPIKELKGFEKIMLTPGESKKVSFLLTDELLGFFNNEGKFVVEAGEFDVMIGTNSNEGLQKRFYYK